MTQGEVSLLINAGVAGVFAVFAIVLTRDFIKFIGLYTQTWQEFLQEEREQRAQYMTLAVDAMQKLTGAVNKLLNEIEKAK